MFSQFCFKWLKKLLKLFFALVAKQLLNDNCMRYGIAVVDNVFQDYLLHFMFRWASILCASVHKPQEIITRFYYGSVWTQTCKACHPFLNKCIFSINILKKFYVKGFYCYCCCYFEYAYIPCPCICIYIVCVLN